jgi:2-isopropylmalate synthase
MPIETTPDTLTETVKKSDSMAETRRVPPGKQPTPQRPATAPSPAVRPSAAQASRADDKPVMPPGNKYAPYLDCYQVNLPDRTWPGKRITTAPIWCSVDLRDGNQALIHPMNIEQKLELFRTLTEIGFKEIEIGFPSAAQVEFDFCRALIDQKLIPEDVWPQVLIQCRSQLIERTFEALQGTKQAIVHIYNSTSELQRRVVFHMNRAEIKAIAVRATELVRKLAEKAGAQINLEYSPESFTGTELEYALEVCEAVMAVWEPTPQRKIILNLPATVEMATPNVYADQIEWFCRHLKDRPSVLISLHPHNDRGTAVAAAELALMAGGDRVEGTLFGNGERTGNVDLVTLAVNMYVQGIDPKLNFRDINAIRRVTERCTKLPVHPRHPYVGDLVFTAFSGSHQDAISKGLRVRQQSHAERWEVPYLPIDPQDLGRSYEKIIQINSQSGKGGVAYVMDTGFQRRLPKAMHPEFAAVIQRHSEETGAEVSPQMIATLFSKEYLAQDAPFRYVDFRSWSTVGHADVVEALLVVEVNGERRELSGIGNGPIAAAKQALLSGGCPYFEILDYREHARGSGSDADAIAYIQVETLGGVRRYGAGIDPNTVTASLKALLSALNRALRDRVQSGGSGLGPTRYAAEQFVQAMHDEFGCRLPQEMHGEFAGVVQHAQPDGRGATAAELWDVFTQDYLRPAGPYRLLGFRSAPSADKPEAEECWLRLEIEGREHELHGQGNGPVNACVQALLTAGPLRFDVVDFHEDSLGSEPAVGWAVPTKTAVDQSPAPAPGAAAKVVGTAHPTGDGDAIAYIQIELPDGVKKFGVGIDRKTSVAAVKALLSALNRASERKTYAHDEFIDVMRSEFKVELPDEMHREFQAVMQQLDVNPGTRVSAAVVWNTFAAQYLEHDRPYELLTASVGSAADAKSVEVALRLKADGQEREVRGQGENPLEAARTALADAGCAPVEIVDFHEHSRGSGADAEAIAFVQLRMDGVQKFGAGIDRSTSRALVKALVSAVNRLLAKRTYPPTEAIHVLHAEFGCELPEPMYGEVRELVRGAVEPDAQLPASFIWGLFSGEYLERVRPYRLVGFHAYPLGTDPGKVACSLTLEIDGHRQELPGTGNGPIDACVKALQSARPGAINVTTYEEHARTSGASAEAVAYVEAELDGKSCFGVGIDRNTTKAAIKALLSAVNRLLG